MIVHVGTDLVRISDVAASIEMFGHRYLERVYSSRELALCRSATGAPSASRLAARFAAKESVIKAMRPSDGLMMNEIEVSVDETGAPTMVYSGAAARWIESLHVATASISLTHEGDFAMAVFVAVTV
jgi:holo-[acyl-carrier protein] synthase